MRSEIAIPKQVLEKIDVTDHTYVWNQSKKEYDSVLLGLIHDVRYVQENEKLLKIANLEFVAPHNGYYIPASGCLLFRNFNINSHNAFVLGIIFSEINDALDFIFECNPYIESDPFSKTTNIKWRFTSSYCDNKWFNLGLVSFCLQYLNDRAIITISTGRLDEYGLWRKGDDLLQVGDNLSILFEDGSIVDFPVKEKVIDKRQYNCVLYKEDIDKFIHYIPISCRITHIKQERPDVTREINNDYNLILHEYLSYYFQLFTETVKKHIPTYEFPMRNVKVVHNEFRFNWCYVYLMHDNTNGYYKIGISNKPEYREKTLQSEKPSIEMLACKKFPTRNIAEAIESALHTAYSQHRLRGEWFNLDDVDVAAIIETLQ